MRLLSERHFDPPRQGATVCDLLAAVDREQVLPPHVLRVAAELARVAASVLGDTAATLITETAFRRAVLAGYPDRVARRRDARSDRFVMASGTGARQARESGVYDAEFVAAVDVTGGSAGREALMRLVTGLDRDWLEATAVEDRHELNAESGTVRAFRARRYDQLVLSEQPMAPDPAVAADLIANELLRRPPRPQDEALLRRLRFAEVEITYADLVRQAAAGARRLTDVDLEASLPHDVKRELADRAPERLRVPSGRDIALHYRDDGSISAAVKLQEVFGLAETPRIGRRRVPVTLELLAPNGRPVQVTMDLTSFWTRGYPEVRRELRGRYPKHPWPEDPWTATPTQRLKKK